MGFWKPDALMLKRSTNAVTDLFGWSHGEDIIANDHGAYWLIESSGLATSWASGPNSNEGIGTPPERAFHIRLKELTEVLNLGVMHAGIGTLKWNGNAFTSDAFIPEARLPVAISGTLALRSDSVVEGMNIQYKTRLNVYNYFVRFGYTTNLSLACLPSELASFFVSGEKRVKLAEWAIHSVAPLTGTAPSKVNVQTIVRAAKLPIQYYTNGNWYVENAVGHLTPLRPGTGGNAGTLNVSDSRLYLGAVTALSLFAFVSIMRQKNKTIKESK